MNGEPACLLSVALSVALGCLGASSLSLASADDQTQPRVVASRRMPDGKQWTLENLNVDSRSSYCYDDAAQNCRRYGRLYTWEAARQGCESLGAGWRLPTNDEWGQLARRYGGVREESSDTGKAAYKALMTGGRSGLNALLAGDREPDGQWARLEAHGFYWTATETAPTTAWFYNFGKGGAALNRHRDGDKRRAASVRCVKE